MGVDVNVEVPRDSPEYAAALMLARWREAEKAKVSFFFFVVVAVVVPSK